MPSNPLSSLPVTQTFELALQYQRMGRLEEAEALYHQVIAAQPDHFVAHNNLGLVLACRGQADESVAAFQRALRIAPTYAEAYNNIGIVLAAQDRLDEAAAAFRDTLRLKEGFPEAWNNLGNVLRNQGRPEEAIASYRQALQLQPQYAQAAYGLGNALLELRRIEEAFASYQRALELEPGHADARLNMALLLLLCGDFQQGWPLYESRWEAFPDGRRHFAQPRWNGGPVPGRRVLIHAEQGLGDSLQFIRCAQSVADRGGHVIAECPPPLLDLFRTARGVSEVITAGTPPPSFDLHVPMLSLPLILQTTTATIPADVPYLFADPARSEVWRQRLGPPRASLRVGVAWTGNPQNRETAKRGIALDRFLPLLRLDSIAFFSLQVGPGAEQLRQFAAADAIHDHSAAIQNFADTAAFMANLDLIISVDTATTHLAGALGRPVWTLLPFAADWRWGLNGETTPWYPTMRLFRQTTPGDWESVMERVAGELRILAGAHAAHAPGPSGT